MRLPATTMCCTISGRLGTFRVGRKSLPESWWHFRGPRSTGTARATVTFGIFGGSQEMELRYAPTWCAPWHKTTVPSDPGWKPRRQRRSTLSDRRNSLPRCCGFFPRRLRSARSTIRSSWSSWPTKPNDWFLLRQNFCRTRSHKIGSAASGSRRPHLAATLMIHLQFRTSSAHRRPVTE